MKLNAHFTEKFMTSNYQTTPPVHQTRCVPNPQCPQGTPVLRELGHNYV